MHRRAASIFASLLFCSVVFSQPAKLITIKQAGSLSYDREKHNAKILKGDVICEHEGALLHCDTAYIFEEENRMVAMGHILITKGDSIRVTGEQLEYDGSTRLAKLENNVKCVEKDMTLTTQILTFDVRNSVANYYDGGTLVNRENTLVSRNGHYYSRSKEATFRYDVVLTNPDYKMNSDTLRYRIPTKTAYFLGPSIIISKSDYIYCENGWYDTENEKAQFSRNALLVTSQQKLRGDSLVYDRVKQTGKAYRNVTMTDTSGKSLISGGYAEFRQEKSEAWVTRKPVYTRIMEDDSLFIAADTLYHRDIDSTNNFLNAYRNVRVYKKNMQAMADSASMTTSDSLLKFFGAPMIWSERMQASAKFIEVETGSNRIKGFILENRAFLIEQPDSNNARRFNQTIGRTINGYFTGDSIRKVIVKGDAEIYYYPENEGRPAGLNRTTCEEIRIVFSEGKISRVTLMPKTDGTVDPMRDVDPERARLKGFNWSPHKRPGRFTLHGQ